VAIANMRIPLDDIERAFKKNKKPNESYGRQANLYNILNAAESNNVQLLVLPEVSIPVSWLPFMVSHARRHQVGLVFGLEHWVIDDVAYNLIVEALPFKVDDKYNSCLVNVRIKNHYAPAEKAVLEKVCLTPGEPKPHEYQYCLHQWSGINLTSYNCFELANIEHRSLFRSELDLLVASVWNKDTHYYDHILESAVRDLFCYVTVSGQALWGQS
jgi:predicted amidohydrolase